MESTENNVKTDVVMRYPKGRDKNKRAQAVFFEVQSDMEGGAYLKRKAIDYKGKTWGCIEVEKFDLCSEPEDGYSIEASCYVSMVYDEVAKQLNNETRRHIPIKKNILIIPKSKPDDSYYIEYKGHHIKNQHSSKRRIDFIEDKKEKNKY